MLLGRMKTWITRFFLTFAEPLTVELVRVAVTTTSAVDVSAVYRPPDVMTPAEAAQCTDTGTLSPTWVRP